MPAIGCLALIITLMLIAKIGWVGVILLIVSLKFIGAVLRLLLR